jgi:hypothetical protein
MDKVSEKCTIQHQYITQQGYKLAHLIREIQNYLTVEQITFAHAMLDGINSISMYNIEIQKIANMGEINQKVVIPFIPKENPKRTKRLRSYHEESYRHLYPVKTFNDYYENSEWKEPSMNDRYLEYSRNQSSPNRNLFTGKAVKQTPQMRGNEKVLDSNLYRSDKNFNCVQIEDVIDISSEDELNDTPAKEDYMAKSKPQQVMVKQTEDVDERITRIV